MLGGRHVFVSSLDNMEEEDCGDEDGLIGIDGIHKRLMYS